MALKRARSTYKTRLTKFETFVEVFRKSTDAVEILEIKVAFLQRLWPEKNEIQDRIATLDETDDRRDQLDERYRLLVGKARGIINSRRVSQNNQQNEHRCRDGRGGGQANELKAKLPVMNLPTFDGNPEQ